MYRVSPITYFVGAMACAGIAGVEVQCSSKEVVRFDPPAGQNCISYARDYLLAAGGRLLNPDDVQQCEICPVSSTDDVIGRIGISYRDRWRDLGITLGYNLINVAGLIVLYWLFRVPKRAREARG